MRKTRGCFHTYMQADAPASPPPLPHIEKQDPHRPEEWWATSHILWGETVLSQDPVGTEMSQKNVLCSSVLDCIRTPVMGQYDLVFQSLPYSLHHRGRNANITDSPKAGGCSASPSSDFNAATPPSPRILRVDLRECEREETASRKSHLMNTYKETWQALDRMWRSCFCDSNNKPETEISAH